MARIWCANEKLRVAAKALLYLGTVCGLGVLVWHALARRSWLPLEDNFDALVWLGLLLALFVLYTQRAHPLRGLDWFLVPVIVMLLISAAVFGKAERQSVADALAGACHERAAAGKIEERKCHGITL